MKELAKQYDPSQVEDRIYQFWLDTKADPDKKPYTPRHAPRHVTKDPDTLDNPSALWPSAPTLHHPATSIASGVSRTSPVSKVRRWDGFLTARCGGNRIVSQLKKAAGCPALYAGRGLHPHQAWDRGNRFVN